MSALTITRRTLCRSSSLIRRQWSGRSALISRTSWRRWEHSVLARSGPYHTAPLASWHWAESLMRCLIPKKETSRQCSWSWVSNQMPCFYISARRSVKMRTQRSVWGSGSRMRSRVLQSACPSILPCLFSKPSRRSRAILTTGNGQSTICRESSVYRLKQRLRLLILMLPCLRQPPLDPGNCRWCLTSRVRPLPIFLVRLSLKCRRNRFLHMTWTNLASTPPPCVLPGS